MSDLINELGFYAAKKKWPIALDGMPDLLKRAADALSETEQRVKDARREALEKAAAIIDANMLCAADDGREVLHPRSNPGNKVGAAYAAAIRALIPSEPHDAEGRD